MSDQGLSGVREYFNLDAPISLCDVLSKSLPDSLEVDGHVIEGVSSQISLNVLAELFRQIDLSMPKDRQVYSPVDRDFLLGCIKEFTNQVLSGCGVGPVGVFGRYTGKTISYVEGGYEVVDITPQRLGIGD